MLERKLAAERQAMLCAGTIAASIYNANPFRSSEAEPVSPLDFLPANDRRRFEPEQTIEEQIAILTEIFGCGPGKEV